MEHQSGRILVADDEDAIRLTMELLLRKRGYTVATAPNGKAALALIEQEPFDLLILDLKMPGVNGVEVARRAQTLQPAVAILILTGSTSIGDSAVEEELEQFDYIIKTASPQQVLGRVAAIMEKQTPCG